MKPIISVEELGKNYTIRHEGQTRYKSLREEIFALPQKILKGSGQSREEFWALKDVSFDVMPGDRVGVIGRNGAGKSTLLKLLSRITKPTTGRITLRGRVASLLEVGTGFHPELTGRENIFLNGAILGMGRVEVRNKFDEIVDFAGVEKFLDTPVKRYSSGMYVRLAFAVAAHLEPEILIVDEVLAVGDAEFQKRCLTRMGELSSHGRTILFVTHNLNAMLSLCNRGILLEKGELTFDASAQDTYSFYLERLSSQLYSLDKPASLGGSGGAHIERVWVETSAGKNIGLVSDGCSVKFYLKALLDEEYRNSIGIKVSFGIDTVEGERVYTVTSSWSGMEVDTSTGYVAVSCELPSVPLVPGQYLVSGVIAAHEVTLVCVVHCASFEIMPRKGNGYVAWRSDWGKLDLPCRFENFSPSMQG